MDCVAPSVALEYVHDDPKILGSWAYGTTMPRIIRFDDESAQFIKDLCKMEQIFPGNMKELHLEYIDKIIFLRHILAKISMFSIIAYPQGVKQVCQIASEALENDDELNYTPTEESYITESMKNSYLSIEFSLIINTIEDSTSTLVAKFSMEIFEKEQNRFCKYWKSHNFCHVSFKINELNIDDILFEQQNQKLCSSDYSTIALMNLAFTALKAEYNLQDTVTKIEKISIFKQNGIHLKKILLHGFDLLSEKFHFISTNINGALKYKYVFTSIDVNEICRKIFQNPAEVINSDKTMLLPLRLGLFNTTCIKSAQISPSDIPDISENSINFTDGCGQISFAKSQEVFEKYLANYYQKKLIKSEDILEYLNDPQFTQQEENINFLSPNLPDKSLFPHEYEPCAFQIRYKGYKGMLVKFDILDDVNFPQSMKKFETSVAENDLYIAGISHPAPNVILSSELIYLFEALCSRNEIEKYLNEIIITKRIDSNDEPITKLIYRGGNAAKNAYQKHNFLNDNIDKQMMDEFGIQATSIFTKILKLNTLMPNSAHVYGVADYSRKLTNRQIFLQITDKSNKKRTIEGGVYITKTPALFPSDICYFEAVSIEELKHLHDVVVFSTVGIVSPTSRMASADLDGDQFYVFWDDKLISLFGGHDKSEIKKSNGEKIQKKKIQQ